MVEIVGGWEEATGRSWNPLPAEKSSKASKSIGRSRSAGVITPEAIPLCGVLYPVAVCGVWCVCVCVSDE